MSIFASIDMIRTQGLPEAEKGFVAWAIDRATDQFIYGCQPPMQRFDYGMDGSECEIAEHDITAVLLSPVSFAAVISDLCGQLKIDVPAIVAAALGDDDGEVA